MLRITNICVSVLLMSFCGLTGLAAELAIRPASVPVVQRGADGSQSTRELSRSPESASRSFAEAAVSPMETTLVYSCTQGDYLLSSGAAHTPIADDIGLAAGCGCDLTSYTVRVHGGGDGSGTFSVWLSLWDDCPSGGGQAIGNTDQSFADLSDNTTIELTMDLSQAPVAIPPRVWLSAEFSTATAGVIAGDPPEVGQSFDVYEGPSVGCSAKISPYEYAAFYAQLSCESTPAPAEPVDPDPPIGAEHLSEDVRVSWNKGPDLLSKSNDGPEAIVTALKPEEWLSKARLATASNGLDGNWCATQELFEARNQIVVSAAEDQCYSYGTCDQPDVRDMFTPSATDSIKTYRLVINVFCWDTGTGCAAQPGAVEAQIATLNNAYRPWRIQFVHEVNFINDTRFRSYTPEEDVEMKYAYADSPESKLNVYVVRNVEAYSFGTFPWDPRALTPLGGIVMDRGHFSPTGSVLAHEIGHNLGLWHTFHGVSEVDDCSQCYEESGATNRDETGDRCSDTDPTPRNYDCAPPGGTDWCSGNPWGETDYHNTMSYAPSACRTEFTPQQAGRSRCWTDHVLSSWLTGSCVSESTFDVRLGTEDPPTSAVCEDTLATFCDVKDLECNTTYHWQVVATNPPPSASTDGPIWSFTTEGGVPQVPGDPQPPEESPEVPITTDLAWNGGEPALGGELLFGSIYQSDSLWWNDAGLVLIDPSTGAATELTEVFSTAYTITEIEWSPDGETLYATTGAGSGVIHRIDVDTGMVISAVEHAAGAINGLEFDAGGILLGTHVTSPRQPSTLVRVDLVTGELETIGYTGFSAIGGLAFDATFSNLYGITSGGDVPPLLLRIDSQTGEATSIGSTGLGAPASSLEFTLDGRLITATTDGVLYELNVDTGEATSIGNTGIWKVSGLSVRVGASEPCTPLYDVYLGTTNPPATLVCTGLSTPRCTLGVLDCHSTYYWQVVANSRMLSASTPGPIWSFGTPTGSDDCMAATPLTPNTDPSGSHLAKNRYISMVIPEGIGQDTAIRVTLASLHHPESPDDPPDFTAWEGEYRWVNSLNGAHTCPDSPVFETTFRCVRLGCEPEYRNWAAELGGEPLHVSGAAVVPSSQYDVAQFPSHCRGVEESCTGVSGELAIPTAIFGDVDPLSDDLVVLDIARIVDHLKGAPYPTTWPPEPGTGLFKPRVHMRPNVPDALGENVGVLDVATGVDAVKGNAYWHFGDFGPCTDACPGEAACP